MQRLLMVAVVPLLVLAMVLSGCTAPPPPAAAGAAAAGAAAGSAAAGAAAAPAAAPAAAAGFGEVLKEVQARGKLKCGMNPANPGFSMVDADGKYSGLDIDLCRAFATAIFNDPNAVEFVPTTGETRFTLLQNGDIDVLVRSTTHTFTRDTDLALNFAPTYFYDGQGIMVRKDSGITKLEDLNGATICMGRGATTELNIADAMAAKNLTYTPSLFDDPNDVNSTFEQGRCDAMSNDKSGLSSSRTTFANPDDYTILDVTLSKEPLAPVVRHGDDQWLDIVNWVLYALWTAEEKGITQANVDDMKANSQDAEVRRLLGVEDEQGKKLGLSNDWVYNMIKAGGNFGEIYDRNLGPETKTAIPRGINALWTNGGLLYSPPFR
ncbi:MAG: amino acid ABC transporter substrate-binding protein [Caldilineaceae bacterium]